MGRGRGGMALMLPVPTHEVRDASHERSPERPRHGARADRQVPRPVDRRGEHQARPDRAGPAKPSAGTSKTSTRCAASTSCKQRRQPGRLRPLRAREPASLRRGQGARGEPRQVGQRDHGLHRRGRHRRLDRADRWQRVSGLQRLGEGARRPEALQARGDRGRRARIARHPRSALEGRVAGVGPRRALAAVLRRPPGEGDARRALSG